MAHRVIPGDLSRPEIWAALDEFLRQTWEHPLIGPMPIHAACVDSGGHFTAAVTRFCDERMGRRMWAIKGAPGARPAWPKRQSKATKGRVWLVGVDSLRQTLVHRFRIVDGTAGRVHFPLEVGLPFFEQLNSEFLRTEYRHGKPVRTWERRRGRAAEAWDCGVYSLAALHGLMAHGVHVDVEAAKLEQARVTGAAQEPAYRVSRSKFVTGGL
jgi:phage terminase large subunit GpA-like protein